MNPFGLAAKLANGKSLLFKHSCILFSLEILFEFNVFSSKNLCRFAAKQGIEDLTVHDFKLLLGVDIQITLSKADRMIYGESAMTHAMTFTAVSCDVSVFKSIQ